MMESGKEKEVEIFHALSHPVRLMIVEELLAKKKCVTEIRYLLKVRQPNISQHLLILRMSGIVDYEQSGKTKCYFLKNPQMMKEILAAAEDFVSLKPVFRKV